MQEAIEQYLASLTLERGLSPTTVTSYRHDLRLFSDFCKRQGIASAGNVTAADVRAFLRWLQETQPETVTRRRRSDETARRGREPATVARKLAAIKGLFRFLVAQGQMKRNPTSFIESPRLWRRLPVTLNPSEVGQVLESITDHRLAGRDLALFELLYGAGLRVSEVASLEVGQVNLEAGFLRCIGKGNKERLGPMGRPARSALVRYIETIRPGLVKRHPTTTALFVGQGGGRLTRQRIWQLVRRYALQGHVAKRVGPHTFRHSFATHLLAGGADLRVVQELLGHANITTTQRYTQVDRSRLKTVHEQFHPRP